MLSQETQVVAESSRQVPIQCPAVLRARRLYFVVRHSLSQIRNKCGCYLREHEYTDSNIISGCHGAFNSVLQSLLDGVPSDAALGWDEH